jgi:hypothetical protein
VQDGHIGGVLGDCVFDELLAARAARPASLVLQREDDAYALRSSLGRLRSLDGYGVGAGAGVPPPTLKTMPAGRMLFATVTS